MSDESVGPFLSAAFFCEKLLDEKDGTLSAIRIVDQLTLVPSEIPLPEDKPSTFPINILVKFSSHGVGGTRELALMIKNPAGKEIELIKHPIIFQPEFSGFNFKLALNIGLKDAGVYWLSVLLDTQLFTQIPLTVVFQPKAGESSETS